MLHFQLKPGWPILHGANWCRDWFRYFYWMLTKVFEFLNISRFLHLNRYLRRYFLPSSSWIHFHVVQVYSKKENENSLLESGSTHFQYLHVMPSVDRPLNETFPVLWALSSSTGDLKYQLTNTSLNFRVQGLFCVQQTTKTTKIRVTSVCIML